MSEMEVFERRVADALAWYADDVSPEVDARAVAHRVALGSPRRRVRALSWRTEVVPRRAWAFLLLAGLIAATIGGAILVGSRPQRKLPAIVPPVVPAFACPPGSTPDKPGPLDQARPPISGFAPMAFDRQAGRIVLVAQGTVDGNVDAQTWTFDVCANTWTRMWPGREPSILIPEKIGPPTVYVPSQLAYDADSDLTIAIDAGRAVWAYDLRRNTWTQKGTAPTDLGQLVYDAASGVVVAEAFPTRSVGQSGLWAYTVETDTWASIPLLGDRALPDKAPGWGLLAYDASVDRIIWYDYVTSGTWRVDVRSGTWSWSSVPRAFVDFDGTGPIGREIAYDEAAARTVVFGDALAIAYDASADRWETLYGEPRWQAVPSQGPVRLPGDLPTGPLARQYHSLLYDPVNERLVVYGGRYRTSGPDGADPQGVWVGTDDVLAFDPATHRWIPLLAPSSP